MCFFSTVVSNLHAKEKGYELKIIVNAEGKTVAMLRTLSGKPQGRLKSKKMC
jgi:hypothetical protein